MYLIHYPHEGGTIPISVFSKFIHFLGASSPLLIVSTCLNLLVRFIQLYVVRKIANKPVFWCFALWCIFGSPATLPWGMMTFGLHSVSCVFPFLFLLLISNKELVNSYSWQIGIIAALAYWFSYTNAILILIFIGFIISHPYSNKVRLRVAFGFVSTIFIYCLVISSFNAGFELSNPNPFFPRDTSTDSFAFGFSKVYEFWSHTLGAALVTESTSFFIPVLSLIIIIGLSLNLRASNKTKNFLYVLFFIVGFSFLYSFSPYFATENKFHFMNFRHLTYLIPIVVYFTIEGWQKFIKNNFLAPALIVVVLIGNSIYSFTNRVDNTNHEEVLGWVLANKYGKHPEKVLKLVTGEANPDLYFVGVGWGTTASIFKDTKSSEIVDNVELLINLKSAYPVEFQDEFMEGVEFAFHENITPKLDKSYLEEIIEVQKL